MLANCVAWLRGDAARETPIRGANWRRDFEGAKELCGFGSPAPDDATAEEKKRRAGNSPDMIHSHYRALVSAKDAKAFFEIVPAGAARKEQSAKGKAGKPGNVVEMPKAVAAA